MTLTRLRQLACIAVATTVTLVPPASGDQPLADVGLEWQLLGRSVARVTTPHNSGTGFLIADDCLLTDARLVEGVAAARIAVMFSDPLGAPSPQPASDETSSFDSWRATTVAITRVNARLGHAFIRLAPKAGVLAGEAYGYLGAREDGPVAGERAHVLAFSPKGGKRYAVTEAIFVPDPGDENDAQPRRICYNLSGGHEWIGAPVLDEWGCLLGVQLSMNHGWVTAITIDCLKTLVPADACPIETCRLSTESEYRLDSSGGLPSLAMGRPATVDQYPPLPRSYVRRVADSEPPAWVPDFGTDPFDFPSDPSAFDDHDPLPDRGDEPPPSNPTPREPAPDPRPDEPHPDNTIPRDTPPAVPEPSVLMLLLFGTAFVIRERRRTSV